jgi:hypothetical protein
MAKAKQSAAASVHPSVDRPDEIARADGKFVISQSKIKTWRKCNYAAHLRYVEKLKRKLIKRPLKFGTIVHTLLEEHYKGGDWQQKLSDIEVEERMLFSSQRDEYGDIIEDIHDIMTEYFLYYKNDNVTFITVNGIKAEHKFEIEIAKGIIATGKVDGFARTKNKLQWLVEHKTFNRMMSEDHRWRNLQSSVYIRISEEAGFPEVDGVLWDNVYSKAPATPDILKSGKISERQILSLPTRVKAVLEREGFKLKDYKMLMESAERNRSTYFTRQFNPMKPKVVNMLFRDFVESAKDMAENLGRRKVKSIDTHCDWCDYEGICRTELTGGDVDYVKEKEYYIANQDQDREVSTD